MVTKSIDLGGTPTVAIRFEFYQYNGNFDDEVLVDPNSGDFRRVLDAARDKFVDVPTDAALGPFVGQQIAAFNAQVAAVPEPGSFALMLGGLAALVGWKRRSG